MENRHPTQECVIVCSPNTCLHCTVCTVQFFKLGVGLSADFTAATCLIEPPRLTPADLFTHEHSVSESIFLPHVF